MSEVYILFWNMYKEER